MNDYNRYLGSIYPTPSIPGGILKGSLPGQGVESRWQTPLLDHLQLYGRLISADARNRIFVMKLFSLVFGVFEKVQKNNLKYPSFINGAVVYK